MNICIYMVIFFKAEDVVNITTKYIPAFMFDWRENVSSITYSMNVYMYLYIYVHNIKSCV